MGQRGQASIEWLGAVALIALVLVAAAGVAGVAGGDAIAAGVVRQIHRALCIVRGGVCDLDQRPCVVAANATEDEVHVNVGIFRIGRDELVLREHRSDGTVLVTFLHDTTGGWDVGVGGDVWVKAAKREIAAGAAARAALLTSLGGGESWTFKDARDAETAMTYLGDGKEPPMGERTERIGRHGLDVSASAQGTRGEATAALRLDASLVDGTVVDDRTGRRTHVIARRGEAEALVRISTTHGSAGGAGEERVSVTTDPSGRPLELSVVRSGEMNGALTLPDVVQPLAGELLGGDRGGRRWVVEQRLDLTEPASLRAAQEMLDALDGPLAIGARADEALRARIAEAGVTEVRTYASESDSSGVVAHGGIGLKVGGGLTDRTDRARLVDARVMGPDGVWRTREDCLEGGRAA
jgi:hypothetical protein